VSALYASQQEPLHFLTKQQCGLSTERLRATAPGQQQGLPLHHRLAGAAWSRR